MFHMMNEARIGVGMGAVALGYTGYLMSLDYARDRPQGRPPQRQGPGRAAGADHRARRRAPHAAGAEGLRRGRAGAASCTARGWSTSSAPAPDADERASARTCCSTCSRRSPRAGRRSGAWRPTAWRSRCTAATATRATTTSSSSTATTGSTRSTRAPTASRGWTCSAARCAWTAAARLALPAEAVGAHRRRGACRRRRMGRGRARAVAGRCRASDDVIAARCTACGDARPHAGQRQRVPRGVRPRRGRVDLARAGPGRAARADRAARIGRRRRARLLRRQAAGRRASSSAGSCRRPARCSTCSTPLDTTTLEMRDAWF